MNRVIETHRAGAKQPAIHIAIDLTALMHVHSGVDRYLKELVLQLTRIDEINRYTVFVNHGDRDLFVGQLPKNFHLTTSCLRPRPVRFAFQQFVLPVYCAAISADVLHSPSFLMPYVRGGQRHLLTVHDMTFFSMPQVHNALRRSRVFQTMVMTSIRRADMINVPSRATRDALMEHVPDLAAEVCITEYGVSSAFYPARPEYVLRETRRLGTPDRYILYVGTIEPRKNLDVLVESYRRLILAGDIEEHLVLAGKHDLAYPSLLKRIDTPELRGRVHLPGFVTEADLPPLYRGARVFVYPSMAEGFGFPPLEAMACAVPVVSTLGSSLEENLGGAAELVPPQDIDALTDALRRLLRDERLREARKRDGLRRAEGFRWENTVRKILNCYRELARRGPRNN